MTTLSPTMEPQDDPATSSAAAPSLAVTASPIPATADRRILNAIRRMIRSVELHSRHLATSHGITSPQLVCLLRVVEKGPITIKQLAEEVYLSPSTIVGIVDRLVIKNLISRERSTTDRRLVHLSATEQGRHLVSAVPSPLQGALAQAVAQLPSEERARIAESLELVAGLMEARQPAPPEGDTHTLPLPEPDEG